MKRLTLTLAVAALMLSVAATAQPAADQVQPAGDTTQVTVDAVVDPAQKVIGRQFNISFDFKYPVGTRVYFPKEPETRPLVAVTIKSDNRTVLGRDTAERHTISFLAVKAGTVALKPFEVPVVLPDGQATMVMTPEVAIEVTSTIGNEEAPALAGPGGSSPVIVRNDFLIWGLAAAGVALLAAIISIFAYRRWRAWVEAHKPPPPPIPPHERAWARLADIERMDLVGNGDFKTLALLVSEVVREFLGARIGFPGTDSTTWETLELVKNRRPDQTLGRLELLELEDFLGLCDLIKFAKFEPSANDALSLLRRAREIVDAVMFVRTVAEIPVAETTAAETPDAETPDAETPDAETPDAEIPIAETPVTETPAEGGDK